MKKKEVCFGIVGSNFIVDTLLKAAESEPRFRAAAFYSRTQERLDEFSAKYNIPHTFLSLEEMAASPHIDAVYIASPNAFHASQSILFMEHGKHVLCEKPMASNAREVKEMITAARKNKVVLMEAMKNTLHPNFSVVRNEINNIGTVRHYFASYCQYSSRYDKYKQGVVLNAFDPALSNGAVMDLGVYTIYPMVVLFGKPVEVHASGLLLSTGADGQGAVNFSYKDMHASILYSKISNSYLPAEIQGEEGTILCDRINSISEVYRVNRDDEKIPLAQAGSMNEYYYELAEFIDLIESGKSESDTNSHAASLSTMEIIDEIRRQIGVKFPADF